MVLNFLDEINCPEYIIQHSKAVQLKAITLSKNFKVDLQLIKDGALLHDVGRIKSSNIDHAVIGAEMLKENGFPPTIVKITERHIGAGISREEAEKYGLPPKDYIPLTLEEKIVAHADNLIHGTREVNIQFVLRKWIKKLGNNHTSLYRLLKLHRELTGERILIQNY